MPEGKQRENVLRIRLTPEERRILDIAAAAAGEHRTSTWARDVLVREAEKNKQGY
jgi:uncharacterized protein (DUF1778 family)